MAERSNDQPVLEPLCFPEHSSKANFSIPLFCLLCDKMFKDVGVAKSDALLHHLLVEHQFVIADVDLIADFKSYIHYWKRRFRESPITDFCSVININSRAEDIGPKLQYNLLCDGLPEDKQLRESLQMNKLVGIEMQGILQHQQQERTDSHFSRNCLFCNEHFEGNRTVLFQHMADSHAFKAGLPDNLIYVNELLDKLEEKLNNLQCLFCEKTFKDRPTLRDHMRKKQHKKINPKNKEFDKYYLINYLEVGKNWHDILDEDDSEINRKSKEESWEDWQEESVPIHCLFCELILPVVQDILNHMKESHNFDLLKIKKNQNLDFYEEVKIVNYIRRQVYNSKCIFCKEKFKSKEALLCHLNEMCHFQLPDGSTSWDQPQYFFPTFENDGLLCALPDDDEDDDQEDDDQEDDECTVYGSYDGVNCGVYGFNHSYFGDTGNYSNLNYNVENEHDIDNIYREDNNGGGTAYSHAMVGNDKQPDIDCREIDGGDGRQHDKNNENDTKNESSQVTDFPVVLVNNDDGDDEKKEDNKCFSKGVDDDHDRNAGHDTKNDFDKDNNLSPALVVNVIGCEDHSDDGVIQKSVDGTDPCENQENQTECKIDSV